MKKYLALKPNTDATHLKVELRYNLGGYNAFTCRQEPRGYYLSAVPIKRETHELEPGRTFTTEAFMAFTGTKVLVKEVTRKSSKAEREAERAMTKWEHDLIAHVLHENNMELEGVLA